MIANFHVVTGTAVGAILAISGKETLELVRRLYIAHDDKKTVNPDSYFLRFADNPAARIIALPAAVTEGDAISGIKWISSFPNNIQQNVQRASAVIILNDYRTGYPLACLEASKISAARTAASAVVAARALNSNAPDGGKLAIVGAGVIARAVLEYFCVDGWRFTEARIYDIDSDNSRRLGNYFQAHFGSSAIVKASYKSAIEASDTVVLATTASAPYIDDMSLFRSGQVVLNISLRDLSEDIILSSTNVFDDIDHCMKANTSPHLAEMKSGGRAFAHGTIADILKGDYRPDASRPIVFSPFGLGVLDVALGQAILRKTVAEGLATPVPDFFDSVARW
jgi:2,3-diaminopropionate biosynthesis protein SbnB